MYEAIAIFYKEISEFADSEEGFAIFYEAVGEEESWDVNKRFDCAKERQKRCVEGIEKALLRMERKHPSKRYAAEQEQNTRIVRGGRAKYEHDVIPDPKVVVPKYMESDYVKELEVSMLEVAANDSIEVKWPFLKKSGDHMIMRICNKAGNRNDAIANLTVGDGMLALENGFAHFPHKPVHKVVEVPDESLDVREEGIIYCSQDPWKQDPFDPDKDESNHNWLQLRGYCMVSRFHKTCKGQPVYIWLSQPDMAFLQAYISLAHRYLTSVGKIMNSETPLFIGMAGGVYLNSKDSPYTKFLEITGVPRMTAFKNRKMFIEHAWDQKDETLRDMSTYACNNSLRIQEKHYLPDETKRKFSAIAHSEFRKSLALAEEAVNHDVNFRIRISKKMDEEFKRMTKEVTEANMQEFLEVQSNLNVKPRMNRIVTEKVKLAIIQTIWIAASYKVDITKQGNVADILMTGKRKVNFSNQMLILRIIDILPSTWECVAVLKQNLIDYCEILNNSNQEFATDSIGLRLIEQNWSQKICTTLDNLGRARTTGSSTLVKKLNDIYLQSGTDKYTFGSSILRNQVINWSTEKQKKEQESISAIEYHGIIQSRINAMESVAGSDQHTMDIGSGTDADNISTNQLDRVDGSECNLSMNESISMKHQNPHAKKGSNNVDISNCGGLVEKEFEVEDVLFSLPKSPLKTQVRVGKQVIDCTGPIQVSNVKTVMKRVKNDRSGNTVFNNDMKRSLLRLYVSLAQNPLAIGKAEMSRQCLPIYNNNSIDLGGDLVRLNIVAFSNRTLGDILSRRGKNGDTRGLAYPIFKVINCTLYLFFYDINMLVCRLWSHIRQSRDYQKLESVFLKSLSIMTK